MLTSFNGGKEIINAYETILSRSDIDLVVVRGALGASAIKDIVAAAQSEEVARTARLQAILKNEFPLEEAEALIAEWSRTMPNELQVFPALESPVGERSGSTLSHFDNATTLSPIIHGPFAISIGTRGQGLFRGLRLPIKLTDEQVMGIEPIAAMSDFEDRHTEYGDFRRDVTTTDVVQEPGDIVLIPGSPHPSLHSVEVASGEERGSVIGSYIMTDTGMTPAELREAHSAAQRLQKAEAYRSIMNDLGSF